jgi:uncharacterized protein (TIGR00299 family) protein
MRLAYLDAVAGISGDMMLGALVHAGAPVDLLRQNLLRLNLGAELKIEEVDRSGIRCVKVAVLIEGRPAEKSSHHHSHHHHSHSHSTSDAHSHSSPSLSTHLPHRSLSTIRVIINDAPLPDAVKRLSIHAFELLGAAEAKIHGVPIETIHFHEVGAVDAIADIVLTATAVHALGIDAWHCSPLNVGGGSVQCAHGRMPVPAPATAELLRGAPTFSSGIEAELVTPTGAALVRALNCTFGPLPPMKVDNIGYGAGTRNPSDYANVLRINIGEATLESTDKKTVQVLEVAVDDLNPQVIAYVMEQAFKLGAFDVMCAPVFMKKNRPGTLLTILSDNEHLPALQSLLFRETSTLGFRIHEEHRVCLERRHVPVLTRWGTARIKVGSVSGQEMNVAPEFDDCRALAEKHGVPVKRVIEDALNSYRKETP